MKRIFIGVKVVPSTSFLKILSDFKIHSQADKIKWTDPDNIHITIAFLGNTEEDVINKISQMLKEKCSGSGAFQLVMKGAGVFRKHKDPTIIWTGIEFSDKIQHLSDQVITGLKELNIKFEDRPFKPHITIGRIKHLVDPENFITYSDQFRQIEIQKIPVNEVILYESILVQPGPIYKPLISISL